MPFVSILAPDGAIEETSDPPYYFADLNLDQIMRAITARKERYTLLPFFYTPLQNSEAIHYRQGVMQDVEHSDILASLNDFSSQMHTVRVLLDGEAATDQAPSKRAWFLDAAECYCDAVLTLRTAWSSMSLASTGLQEFHQYVTEYLDSSWFKSFHTQLVQLRSDLREVRYWLWIRGSAVTVRPYSPAIDYAQEVAETFARFRQGDVKDYTVKLTRGRGMDYVEARIAARVAKLYPALFARLDAFYREYQHFVDPTFSRFDREIQFYVAYVDYMAKLKQHGLTFCYPRVSAASKNIGVTGAFDLALAGKLTKENQPIVCNDFYLEEPEHILVVSGPNQGGKTTFARMFGQLHYLASLGCPVPGREARLFLFDQIFTHFEQQEHVEDLVGKLQHDLMRLHETLSRATPRSIILLNEIFSSTSLQDATFLSCQVLEAIRQLGALAVVVTFIEELASQGKEIVSLVSTVLPDRPEVRTFQIVRRPADGLAYAIALAEKYRLTYDQLKERILS